MAKKLCLFCRQAFKPYPARATRQVTCGRAVCQRKLKRTRQRGWQHRRPAMWREQRNRKVRAWAKAYPRYWRQYRGQHPAYVRRDNSRRVRSRRRGRGVSAKPTL